MNRRRWLRWIPAALLPMAVRGQVRPGKLPLVDDGMKCIVPGKSGDYEYVDCPLPATVPLKALEWGAGKPLNNQCPVCGTMAAPWKAPLKKNLFGCGPLMLDVDGSVHAQSCDGRQSRVIRCLRCNAAFWQDAA